MEAANVSDLPPPDYDEEIDALARSLELLQGFGLYFVAVSQSSQRRRILDSLRESLPGFVLHDVFLREPPANSPQVAIEDALPPGILPAARDTEPRPIVCLFGLENWLAGVDGVRISQFAAALNTTRNSLTTALNCALVILAPQYVILGLQRGAPDFFSVRSGVYFFDTPPDQLKLPALEELSFAGLEAAKSAGIEGRRRQIAEWEDILHGYEALPETRRNPLAEAYALSALATLHLARGNYAATESFLLRALNIYERRLGEKHHDTLSTINKLVALYRAQSKYSAAEPLLHRSLDVSATVSQSDDLVSADVLTAQAEPSRSEDDSAAAESLLLRALAIQETELGPEHPGIATSLVNLALIYIARGDYAAAEPIYRRALKIYETSLGPDHPSTRMVEENLAGLEARMREQ